MQVLITAPIRCWMSDGSCPRRSSLLVRISPPCRASRRVRRPDLHRRTRDETKRGEPSGAERAVSDSLLRVRSSTDRVRGGGPRLDRVPCGPEAAVLTGSLFHPFNPVMPRTHTHLVCADNARLVYRTLSAHTLRSRLLPTQYTCEGKQPENLPRTHAASQYDRADRHPGFRPTPP
jgi:hypothetical protein